MYMQNLLFSSLTSIFYRDTFNYLTFQVNTTVIFLCIAEPSKFVAILNSGYFRFLSISDSGEELELLFSAELKTNCFSLNMVYKMYLSYNFE